MSGAILAQAALMRSKGLLVDDDDSLPLDAAARRSPASRAALKSGKGNTNANNSNNAGGGERERGRRALWEYPYDPALGAEQFAHAKEHIRRLQARAVEQQTAVDLARAVMDTRKDLIDLVRSTILNDAVLLISDVSLREEYKERFKTILDSEALMGLHKAGLELEYRTRIEQLEAELRRSASDESAREKAIEARESEMEGLRGERDAALTAAQQTKRQLTQLQEQFNVLRQNFRDANERFREHNKSSQLLNSEMGALQRIIESQKSEIEDLKMQLSELKGELEMGDSSMLFKRSLADLSSETTRALKRQCDAMLQAIFSAPAGTGHMSGLTAFADSYNAAHRTRKAEAVRDAATASSSVATAGPSDPPKSPQSITASRPLSPKAEAPPLTTQERLEMALADGVGRDARVAKTLRDVAARMRPTVDKFSADTKRALTAAVAAANEAAGALARQQHQLQIEKAEAEAAEQQANGGSGGANGGQFFTSHIPAPIPPTIEVPTTDVSHVTAGLHTLLAFALDALVGAHDREAALSRAGRELSERYEGHIAVLGAALERTVKEMQTLEASVAKANPIDTGGGGGGGADSSPTKAGGRATSFAGDGAAGPSALVLLSAAPSTLKDAITTLKAEVADAAARLGTTARAGSPSASLRHGSPPGGGGELLSISSTALANGLNQSVSASRPVSPLAGTLAGGAARPRSGGGPPSPGAASSMLLPSGGRAGSSSNNYHGTIFEAPTAAESWPVPSEALQSALTSAEALLGSFGAVLGTVATQQSRMQLMARRSSLAKDGQAAANAASQRRRQSLFAGASVGASGGGVGPDPAVELTRMLMELEKQTVAAAGGAAVLQLLPIGGGAFNNKSNGQQQRSRSSSDADGMLRRSSSASSLGGRSDAGSGIGAPRRLILRSSSAIFRAFDPTVAEVLAGTAQGIGQSVRALVARHSADGSSPLTSAANSIGRSGGGVTQQRSSGGASSEATDTNGGGVTTSGGVPLVPQTRHVESLAMTVLALTRLLGKSCATLCGAAEANDRLLEDLEKVESELDTFREAAKGAKSGSAGSTPQRRGSLQNAALLAAADESSKACAASKKPRQRAVYCQTDIDATSFRIGKGDEDDDDADGPPAPPVMMPILNTFKFGDAPDDPPASAAKATAAPAVGAAAKPTEGPAAKNKTAKKGTAVAGKRGASAGGGTPPPTSFGSASSGGKGPTAKSKTVVAGGGSAASPPRTAVAGKTAVAAKNSSASSAAPKASTAPLIDSYEAADGTVGFLTPSSGGEAGVNDQQQQQSAASPPSAAASTSSSTMMTRSEHYLLMLEARKSFEAEMMQRLAAAAASGGNGGGGGGRDIGVGRTRPSSAATSHDRRGSAAYTALRRLSSSGLPHPHLSSLSGASPLQQLSQHKPPQSAASSSAEPSSDDPPHQVGPNTARPTGGSGGASSKYTDAPTSESVLGVDLDGDSNSNANNGVGVVSSADAEALEDLRAMLEASEVALAAAEVRVAGAEAAVRAMAAEADAASAELRAAEARLEEAQRTTQKPTPQQTISTSCGSTVHIGYQYVQTDEDYFASIGGSPRGAGGAAVSGLAYAPATNPLTRPILSTNSLFSYSHSRPPSAKTARGPGQAHAQAQPQLSTHTLEFSGSDVGGHASASRPSSAHFSSAHNANPLSGGQLASNSSNVSIAHPKAADGAHDPPRIPTTQTQLVSARPSSPHRGLGLGPLRPASAAGKRSGSPHEVTAGLAIYNRAGDATLPYHNASSAAAVSGGGGGGAGQPTVLPPLLELYQGSSMRHQQQQHVASAAAANASSLHHLTTADASTVNATPIRRPRSGGRGDGGGVGSPSLGGSHRSREAYSRTPSPARTPPSPSSPAGREAVQLATAALLFDDAAAAKARRHSGVGANVAAQRRESQQLHLQALISEAAHLRSSAASSAQQQQQLSVVGEGGGGIGDEASSRRLSIGVGVGGQSATAATTGRQVNISGTVHAIADVSPSRGSLRPASALQQQQRTIVSTHRSQLEGVDTSSSDVCPALALFDPNAEARAAAEGPQPFIPPYPSHHPALRTAAALATNVTDELGASDFSRPGTASNANATRNRVVAPSAGAPRFRPASAAAIPNARIYSLRDRGPDGRLVTSHGGAAHQQHAALVATLVEQYSSTSAPLLGGGIGGVAIDVAARPLSPPRRASELDRVDSGRSEQHNVATGISGGTAAAPSSSGDVGGGAAARGGHFYSRRLNFLRSSPDRLRSSLFGSSQNKSLASRPASAAVAAAATAPAVYDAAQPVPAPAMAQTATERSLLFTPSTATAADRSSSAAPTGKMQGGARGNTSSSSSGGAGVLSVAPDIHRAKTQGGGQAAKVFSMSAGASAARRR